MPTTSPFGTMQDLTRNVEKWRGEGIANSTIANYISGADPHFNEKYTNVKSSYGDSEDTAKSFINYRFYGDVNYQPQKVEAPSFPDRIMNRIYGAGLGVRQSLDQYNSGQQGAIDTGVQVGSRIARGIMAPATETVSTASELTGLNDVIKSGTHLAGMTQVGRDVGGLIQSGAQAVSQEAQHNPQLRSALDFTGAVGDAAMIYGAPQMVNQIGQGVGAIGKGAIEGAKYAGGAIKSILPTRANSQTPIAKEAMSKGIDEKLVHFIQDSNPDEKFLMKRMTVSAEKGATQLGGSSAPKQAVGDQLNRYAEHVIGARKTAGKALGNLVDSVAEKPVNLTSVRENLLQSLQDKGVAFNEKGRIISIAGAADDEIPVLQKIVDLFPVDENGTVMSTVKNADLFRKKIFAETNAAKAKLAPTSGGQSVFGLSDITGNKVRTQLLDAIAEAQPNYRPVATAYSRLVTEPSDYFRAIGYKGNLEDISTQALKSGEVAMRTLGNASARPTEAIDKMVQLAQDFGFESPIDIHKIIRYADELENLYPITPTRSLAGEVNKAGVDAAKSAMKSGPITQGYNMAADKVVGTIQKFRGMTPENRTRLLHALFDETSSETSVASMASDPTQAKLNQLIIDSAEGVKSVPIQGAKSTPVMQESVTSPPTLPEPTQGVNSVTSGGQSLDDLAKKYGGEDNIPLSQIDDVESARVAAMKPDDFANLTPEEKATGLIGGSDSVDTLYHGSNKEFGSFDLSKSGNGEGANIFGKGAYLTDSKDVAGFYAKSTAKKDFVDSYKYDGIQGSPRAIYKDGADSLAAKNAIVNEFKMKDMKILDVGKFKVDAPLENIFAKELATNGYSEAESLAQVKKTLKFARENSAKIKNYRGELDYLRSAFPPTPETLDAMTNHIKVLGYDGLKYASDAGYEGIGGNNYVIYNTGKISGKSPLPSVGGAKIPKPLEPLAAEARAAKAKGMTAKEFVKLSEDTIKRSENDIWAIKKLIKDNKDNPLFVADKLPAKMKELENFIKDLKNVNEDFYNQSN